MNYAEEQQTELESLESIYPDTFRKISTSPVYYTLNLVPHPDSDEPNHVNARLHIKYPPEYPEQAPTITVESLKGLSPNTVKDLEAMAMNICKDNSGTCCIYNVCTQIQEWLVQNNIPYDTSLHEQMTAQQDLKKRLERLTFGEEGKTGEHTTLDTHSIQDFDLSFQRKKGTPVTVESFNVWSQKEKKKELEESGPVDDKRDKLTGMFKKRLFFSFGKEIFLEMSSRQLKDNLDKLEQYESSGDESNVVMEKDRLDKYFQDDEDKDEDKTAETTPTNPQPNSKTNKKDKQNTKKNKKQQSKNDKTIVVDDSDEPNKDAASTQNTVVVNDESLFLNMDME
ncbi:hypothetical protein RFI_26117 [Reticulomyxa filosa]|uniref:RWD domain-containing protein n=1 Tax=Reticulomyxa filosa TaxID=46433 RepID=X6MDZ1_RETFI|nr:hypothetical protein RFI_26117 [Reticulomyxa filosa]|eukprot:ETO11260.1 hypothetical protein RFI_26117 [Reticulomyxa filosa]